MIKQKKADFNMNEFFKILLWIIVLLLLGIGLYFLLKKATG